MALFLSLASQRWCSEARRLPHSLLRPLPLLYVRPLPSHVLRPYAQNGYGLLLPPSCSNDHVHGHGPHGYDRAHEIGTNPEYSMQAQNIPLSAPASAWSLFVARRNAVWLPRRSTSKVLPGRRH